MNVRCGLMETLPAAPVLTPAQRAERLGVIFAQWAAEDAKMTPQVRAVEDAKWAEIEPGLDEGIKLWDVDVSDFE